MTNVMTAVERTEEKWAKRGSNPLARYLNWVSLRQPWIWRVRLDLVLLFNLVAGFLFFAAVLSAPDEPGELLDATGTFITGSFVVAAVILPAGFAAYWIYAVTKSVRARTMPRLGRKPGMVTTLMICCSFALWLPALFIVSSAGWHNPSTGEQWYDGAVVEEPAAPAEAPADYYEIPAAPPAETPADVSLDPDAELTQAAAEFSADELERAAEELRRQAIDAEELRRQDAELAAYQDEVKERLVRPSLWHALFDRPVDAAWTEAGFSALRDFAASTPPWNEREHLFQEWRNYNDLMFEPGLFDAFKRSEPYQAMLVHRYLVTTPWTEDNGATRQMIEALRAHIRTRLDMARQDPNYEPYSDSDAVMSSYWPQFRTHIDSDPTATAESSQLWAAWDTAYNEGRDVDAARAAVRDFELRPELHAAFQRTETFLLFAQTSAPPSIPPEVVTEVQASEAFQRYRRTVEAGADPRTGLAVDALRTSLNTTMLTALISTLVLAAALATFTTGLNWGGLGVTLGSAVLALVWGGAVLFAASMASSLSGYDPETFESHFPLVTAFIAGGAVAVLVPLAFVIKDLLGGVLRRGSRLAALTTVWTGGFAIPFVVLASASWVLALPFWPNQLLAAIVLCLVALLVYGFYAKVVHMLIARIASYPQPG